ncbi:MAG: hypothetical protein JOZ55_10755, partial [Alphaproteobacteria bacterium]|nr:hypothetical protein [Alphaproteobacteria bacterium]
MTSRIPSALLRADRALAAAFAVVLATASAAVGASAVYTPRIEEIHVARIIEPVVKTVVA